VNKLQSQEKELKKEMAAKQKQDLRLAGAITAAIRRARDLAIKEEAKKRADAKAASDKAAADKAATAKTSRPAANDEPVTPATLNTIKSANKTVFTTDEDLHLSGDFEKHKGQLPWPLSGTVSMAFGPHEYIKGIYHNNQGVTIDVAPGTSTKAVYEGEVTGIFNIGDVQCVILRHGKYFTGYSNLASVTVSKGQHVRLGEVLGRVGEIGQLEFLLSDEKGKYFDPEKWLRR
ncbi:MAG: peptidoglycan DD-metalloendopeptidase family protein, partial [Bacteroidetes bacterium]|nr:peptidoglycan DD-metalloendopeptidase family protein [Bacteroidota bacterium]